MISQTAAEEGWADLSKLLSNFYSALNLKHIEASKSCTFGIRLGRAKIRSVPVAAAGARRFIGSLYMIYRIGKPFSHHHHHHHHLLHHRARATGREQPGTSICVGWSLVFVSVGQRFVWYSLRLPRDSFGIRFGWSEIRLVFVTAAQRLFGIRFGCLEIRLEFIWAGVEFVCYSLGLARNSLGIRLVGIRI